MNVAHLALKQQKSSCYCGIVLAGASVALEKAIILAVVHYEVINHQAFSELAGKG